MKAPAPHPRRALRFDLLEVAAEFPRHPVFYSVQDVVAAVDAGVHDGLSLARMGELSHNHRQDGLDVGGGTAWYTIFYGGPSRP